MPRKAREPDLTTQHGRLMSARLAAGFATRTDAAEAFGMPKSTYESHENGLRATKGIPIENARAYVRKFRISLSWLLTGQGDRIRSTGIEITGFIGAGAEIEDIEGAARFEEIGVELTDADDIEWFEVVGTSMIPRVYPGEYVGFSRKEYNAEELVRQEALVYLEDGRRFFKKLMRGSAPGLFDLISYNDEDRPDEAVKRAGKVAMIVSQTKGR